MAKGSLSRSLLLWSDLDGAGGGRRSAGGALKPSSVLARLAETLPLHQCPLIKADSSSLARSDASPATLI